MKRLIILIIMLTFVNTVFPQTQTTLQDLGRLVNHTTVSPNVYNGSAVKGIYLYNAGDGNAYIYKLTDPTNPTYIKTIPSLTGVQRVWIGENYLFVYTGSAIKIYDLTDPENPAFKADYTAGVDLHKVAAKGNYMFVLYLSEYNTHKDGSFEIVDITNPTSPQLKGTYKPSNYEGRSFFFSETANHVYVAHFDNASTQGYIRELDYTDPTNPTIVRELVIAGAPVNIAVNGTTIFVLKDGGWKGPSILEAYDLNASPITKLATQQMSIDAAWDMHVFGNSISASVLDADGFMDFTWNSTTNSFDAGQKLNIINSSQISWYMVSTQTSNSMQRLNKATSGYWVYFYYYVLELAKDAVSETKGYYVRLVEKMVWVEIPNTKVTLTTTINPPLASTEGCTVSPSPGQHEYNKNSDVSLSATENATLGWNFKEWTGDVSGTSKSVSVKMDKNKNAVANFVKPTLTLSASGNNKFHCPNDIQKKDTVLNFSLCASIDDDWKVTSIQFSASGNGYDDSEIKTVRLFKQNIKLGETVFNKDNGTVTFAVNITVPKGQCVSLMAEYEFIDQILITDSSKKYTPSIKMEGVTAIPLNYANGIKTPQSVFSGGTIVYGIILNTRTNENFSKIQDAVNSSMTKDGDVIEVCPCELSENINVTKSLTIKSISGKDVTKITALNSTDHVFEISSSDVTIDGFTIKGAFSSTKAGIFVDHSLASISGIKKLHVSSSSITGNWWGVFVQGPQNSGKDSSEVSIDGCYISNNANDGVTATGLKTLLTITGSSINYNKNGLQGGGTVNVTNSKIKNNKGDGVKSAGNIYLNSYDGFVSEVSDNDGSGLYSNLSTIVLANGVNGGKVQINNNGEYGIYANVANFSGSNLSVIGNGRIKPENGTAVTAYKVEITNATIQDNRSSGIDAVQGVTIISENGITSEISNNDGNGIIIFQPSKDGNQMVELHGDGSGKVNVNNNGKFGIQIPFATMKGRNITVSDNGRLDAKVGTGIYAQKINSIENITIKNNKGYGIECQRDCILYSENNFTSEITNNDLDGISIDIAPLNQLVKLWGYETGYFEVKNNGTRGISNSFGKVSARNIEVSGNGTKDPGAGEGIIGNSIELTNFRISNNNKTGINCGDGELNLSSEDSKNSIVWMNKGFGIFSESFTNTNKIYGYGLGNIWVYGNDSRGIYLGTGKTVLRNVEVKGNGKVATDASEGIYASDIELENTTIENNKSDGLITEKLKYKSGLVKDNNGWGIIIWRNPTLSRIDPGVSIIGNTGGAVLFKQSLNKSSFSHQRISDQTYPVVFNGCHISENHGDGIRNERNESFTIINSNISNNTGFGINNVNSNSMINAGNNWWGSSSGPAGLGAGAGDKVSSNVSFSGWLTKPVSVIIACNKDTSFSNAGSTDTIEISFKNYQRVPDKLKIMVIDSLGWLITSKNFVLDSIDSSGAKSNFIFSIPVGTAPGTINKIKINATSELDSNQAYNISYYNKVYNPFVSLIVVTPSQARVGQNNKMQFTAKCYDQLGKNIAIPLTWSASKGSIDNYGMFTAPADTGWCTVSAKKGIAQASVNAHIVSSQSFLSKIVVVPDSVMINRHAKQQFYALGFDQFDSTFIFEAVWSATGGDIDPSGLFTAGDAAGNYLVSAKNQSNIIVNSAKVVITQLVGVEQNDIPTEYYISQNYPNPFNPSTKINYSLPYSSRVKISVYNILGQLVTELIDEEKLAGNYTTTWNAKIAASGIYFCRIVATGRAKDFVKTMKMILIK